MKTIIQQKSSGIALLIIAFVFIAFRFVHIKNNDVNGYNATSWDALGYYMYLPSVFIYEDVKELQWLPQIDSTYHVTGGHMYQAIQLESGTYTNKYLCGVAVLQLPFFWLGHIIAGVQDYPQDGFSAPYQYSIMFGGIVWVLIGFWVLRKVLRYYFKEEIIALTILFLGLTSNLIQYSSIDGGMSHTYIFPLYALLLLQTIKWHERPSWKSAVLIGATIGLATISRPTELIMLFIPLLWNTTEKTMRKRKWELVWNHKTHLIYCLAGGLIAMLPQFIYWYYTTGSVIYDVGSKWYFLTPWFRVLFGPEKGWFLYTPVAILMIAGFFLMKGQPYKRSILTFCLLNIWIIISWSDWKYGASYSTRALVQSYPVFAFGLACTLAWTWNKKQLKLLLFGLLIFLTWVNFHQLSIYNKGVLENFSIFLIQ
jgi:hypothetical protein